MPNLRKSIEDEKQRLKQEMEESIEKNNEIIEELTKFRESQE